MELVFESMYRIIQVIHTFIVRADDLAEAQAKISESVKLDPKRGVTLTGRQVKCSDPVRLDD